MSATNVDRVQDYFYRQYERQEGSAKENIYDLFAEDAIIQLTDGSTVALEDIARTAAMLRKLPTSERIMETSDFKEEGDTVAFHSYVRFRHPETGKWNEMHSDVVWRFNGQGRIVEGKSSASIVAAMSPSSS